MSMPVTIHAELPGRVVSAVEQAFDKLPKNGKPAQNEWAMAAAILAAGPAGQLEVVSLGIGSKCVGRSHLRGCGVQLHDCHSEILAQRGLKRALLEEMKAHAQRCTPIASVTPRKSEACRFGLLEHDADVTCFSLRPGIQLHLYISDSPCGEAQLYGDASSEIEEQASERQSAAAGAAAPGIDAAASAASGPSLASTRFGSRKTGAKEVPDVAGCSAGSPTSSRLRLRTKSGRSDIAPERRTHCMCCSDKVMRWVALGMAGRLAGRFLRPDRSIAHAVPTRAPLIPLTSVVVSADQAAWLRVLREHGKPSHAGESIASSGVSKLPQGVAVVWRPDASAAPASEAAAWDAARVTGLDLPAAAELLPQLEALHRALIGRAVHCIAAAQGTPAVSALRDAAEHATSAGAQAVSNPAASADDAAGACSLAPPAAPLLLPQLCVTSQVFSACRAAAVARAASLTASARAASVVAVPRAVVSPSTASAAAAHAASPPTATSHLSSSAPGTSGVVALDEESSLASHGDDTRPPAKRARFETAAGTTVSAVSCAAAADEPARSSAAGPSRHSSLEPGRDFACESAAIKVEASVDGLRPSGDVPAASTGGGSSKGAAVALCGGSGSGAAVVPCASAVCAWRDWSTFKPSFSAGDALQGAGAGRTSAAASGAGTDAAADGGGFPATVLGDSFTMHLPTTFRSEAFSGALGTPLGVSLKAVDDGLAALTAAEATLAAAVPASADTAHAADAAACSEAGSTSATAVTAAGTAAPPSEAAVAPVKQAEKRRGKPPFTGSAVSRRRLGTLYCEVATLLRRCPVCHCVAGGHSSAADTCTHGCPAHAVAYSACKNGVTRDKGAVARGGVAAYLDGGCTEHSLEHMPAAGGSAAAAAAFAAADPVLQAAWQHVPASVADFSLMLALSSSSAPR